MSEQILIDLHTHSLLSDGCLLPAELLRRCEAAGYSGLAITDHVDSSNVAEVLRAISRFCQGMNGKTPVMLVPGVEITHVPPGEIEGMVRFIRSQGKFLIVGHGETPVEPVTPGTNRGFILAGVDILAHPGLISPEETRLAAERGVCLEITARKGHCLGNGHVARQALAHEALLVMDTDTHGPDDLLSPRKVRNTICGAGIEPERIPEFIENSLRLARKYRP